MPSSDRFFGPGGPSSGRFCNKRWKVCDYSLLKKIFWQLALVTCLHWLYSSYAPKCICSKTFLSLASFWIRLFTLVSLLCRVMLSVEVPPFSITFVPTWVPPTFISWFIISIVDLALASVNFLLGLRLGLWFQQFLNAHIYLACSGHCQLLWSIWPNWLIAMRVGTVLGFHISRLRNFIELGKLSGLTIKLKEDELSLLDKLAFVLL